jgi:hypothetical protein
MAKPLTTFWRLMSCFRRVNDECSRNDIRPGSQGTGLEERIAEIVNSNREEIDRRFPKIQRRVSGYNLDEFVRNGKFNLSKLVVGSEGTLAAVHQAKVRIEPRPAATALCVVHFKDIVDSIRATDVILPFNHQQSNWLMT